MLLEVRDSHCPHRSLPDRIIVVDDCSTDESAAVAAALGARVVRGDRRVQDFYNRPLIASGCFAM